MLSVSLLLVAAGCGEQASYQTFTGTTMGTQYRVQASCSAVSKQPDRLQKNEIDAQLEAINALMSTYQADSVLSRFNASPPGDWYEVPRALVVVVKAALSLSEQSEGAYDITVGPLVNLWGFGPEGRPTAVPDTAALENARERVGYKYLHVRAQPPALRKDRDLYVDLSSIAKGYGVDVLAEWLAQQSCGNFLVDIGGEVRTRGVNSREEPWRIGVEVPDPARFGMVQRIIDVSNLSVATSGDYRNFLEFGGKRYSHTIDPRTGRPVQHHLASVTVLHRSAMWADGYATLLEVLGGEQGYAFAVERHLAALLIERSPEGISERETPDFEPLLEHSGIEPPP